MEFCGIKQESGKNSLEFFIQFSPEKTLYGRIIKSVGHKSQSHTKINRKTKER
jgi:hypothetical protein